MTQDLVYDQIPISFGFYTKKTFSNYIVGNNLDLYTSLLNVTKEKQLILIYGAKASGKSHICEALSHLDLGHYLNINENTQLDNINCHDQYDLIIIDNLDKIILKNHSEEKIFSLINNQILNNNSAVVTSTKDIDKCNLKLNDLSSRLISDKIFNIKDLNDEEKIEIMMSYCSDRGLEVSEKVLNYIINNCSRDLYFLCAFIKTLDHASLSMKRRVTIPFIKKAISLHAN
jgi:DnaA family protein